ncbi:GNAT family N-acetyltransferase [Halocatena marina]|uniref:GNAT family N-acetyltransferase n=1 Tax=Halocatena marina TaxID=2934937 RepID=A0ABD5YLQ6_9EURY|nr:GNAT family N-acetyltransferase [Halocatena marina]
MDILRLPADEAAVRRYIEDLWLPYNRELEAIVDHFALVDDVDLVTEELEWRLDRHEAKSYRAWVAVEGSHDENNHITADIDSDFVGFITTDIDESSSVFDRPDRLVVCDIYVRKPYRGTGLANDLIERAKARAREQECANLTLDVDVDNERAIAFYEKLGFEPLRQTLIISVDG